MRLASEDGVGFAERQRFRWYRLRKRVHQFARYRPGADKQLLFIVGCQRSGTSMIHHLLRLDLSTVTYDEVSPLSAGDLVEGLRWGPLPEIRRRFAGARAALVVTKPLVESQNLDRLLGDFPGSRAVWMYRDYRAVARSNVAFLPKGTSHRDLMAIVTGDPSNWRAENLDPAVRELVRELYRPDLSAEDAAALFWYARNSLLFSRGLATDERVRTCRYEELLADPGGVMRALYRFVDRPFPGERIVADVDPRSRRPVIWDGLDPAIAAPCANLLIRLESAPRLVAIARTP